MNPSNGGGLSRYRVVLGFFCLLAFAAISAAMRRNWTEPMDTAVREAIQSAASPGLTRFARWLTNAGEFTWQLLVCLMGVLFLHFATRRRRPPLLLAVNLGGVWLLNQLLKNLYRRDRPTIRHLVEAGGYSFPSGHSMSSAAFYGMIGYLLWNAYRRKWRGAWIFPLLAVVLTGAVGWSRIYLGVHFLSDVLAGYAAGLLWLLLCLSVYERNPGRGG
ncbi:phosphatase PAP2 family protein [Gorillibacterium sp. sgz500922]|uniref:phosphatase PAP2 family protein n=1 Tax=Gorillibacterium sp. sgz500922 TaxID=3446694 RepID=UPI003F6627EA